MLQYIATTNMVVIPLKRRDPRTGFETGSSTRSIG